MREAARILVEVARALHYAHEQGFVHRDIKPANILIDGHDRVFVTDFGIALKEAKLRLRGDDGCGTFAFMSPEQIHGEPGRIDRRTDLYSLGVVLYQLLTGRLPFEADTLETLRDKILQQEPVPPGMRNRSVPNEVERICLKCLAKSPANRYPTAETLANDLHRWLTQRKSNRFLVGFGVVCYLVVAWFGIVKRLIAP